MRSDVKIEIEIRTGPPIPPKELLRALESTELRYTIPVALYYLECCYGAGDYFGVFGDGHNAAYEWFIWREGKIQTSNSGYGDTRVALRDVLTEVIG